MNKTFFSKLFPPPSPSPAEIIKNQNEQDALRLEYDWLEKRVQSLEAEIEVGNDQIEAETGSINRLKAEMSDFLIHIEDLNLKKSTAILSTAKGNVTPKSSAVINWAGLLHLFFLKTSLEQ